MSKTLVTQKQITIRAGRKAVFDAFVNDIDRWWPRQGTYRYSFAPADTEPRHIRFEPGPGGRYYETFADGREFVIGHITLWEPPSRLVYTWQAPTWPGATQVEILFDEAEGATTVTVRHSGWEAAGVPEMAAGYAAGHVEVLAALAAWVEAER